MLNQIKRTARFFRKKLNRCKFYLQYACVHDFVETDSREAQKKLMAAAPMPESSAITSNQIGSPEVDLTIIVPAYNAEKWVRECLDSIAAQETKYSFLVKVVDDGSTDQTAQIVDQYAADPRFQIIHQENRGYSGARNAALKRIHSEYVMFVDSDDLLLPGAVEVLLEQGYENEADIVEGDGYRFDESGRLGKIKGVSVDCRKPVIWGGPCLKIIRSSLFEQLEFPEGYLYEDTIISSLIQPLAKGILCISDEVYGYRIHSGSITQKHTAELNRVDSFWIMLLVHRHMKELGIPVDYDRYSLTMRHLVFTYRRTILLPQEIKRDIFAATCSFMEEQYSEYLNRNDRNRMLAKALITRDYGKYCVYCEANH